MSFTPFSAVPPVARRSAAPPLAGTALINGTQVLASWTTPADGAVHRFMASVILSVSVLEVGGQVQAAFTDPAGNAATSVLVAAGLAAGDAGASLDRLAAPGTVVSVSQSTALTAGASVAWADIVGL